MIFQREQKDWLASCFKHIKQYQTNKLENALQVLMKHLAATLSRQNLLRTKLNNLLVYKKKRTFVLSLKFFTKEQLIEIPVDNKLGENYFDHFSEQL